MFPLDGSIYFIHSTSTIPIVYSSKFFIWRTIVPHLIMFMFLLCCYRIIVLMYIWPVTCDWQVHYLCMYHVIVSCFLLLKIINHVFLTVTHLLATIYSPHLKCKTPPLFVHRCRDGDMWSLPPHLESQKK